MTAVPFDFFLLLGLCRGLPKMFSTLSGKMPWAIPDGHYGDEESGNQGIETKGGGSNPSAKGAQCCVFDLVEKGMVGGLKYCLGRSNQIW